jgi:hypothetical protein
VIADVAIAACYCCGSFVIDEVFPS